jgi:hypothetical protein
VLKVRARSQKVDRPALSWFHLLPGTGSGVQGVPYWYKSQELNQSGKESSTPTLNATDRVQKRKKSRNSDNSKSMEYISLEKCEIILPNGVVSKKLWSACNIE